MTVQRRNAEMVALLSQDFRRLNNPAHAWADAISMGLGLPGLVGLWPMSLTNGSGQAVDLVNGQLLTNNNNAAFSQAGTGLSAYIGFNGSTQYLSRTSSSTLAISGSEAFTAFAYRGLTLGAWVNFDVTAAAIEAIIYKRDGTNNAYSLERKATGEIRFTIYNSNTAYAVDTAVTVAAGAWTFVCGRFDPSTELKVWANGETGVNTTSIPASIDTDAADFSIGASGTPGSYLDGAISLAWVSNQYLSDQYIDTFYQMTAPLFGVNI